MAMSYQQALMRLRADIQLRGLSKSSHRAYTRQVKEFLKWSGKAVEELDEMDVRQYIGRMVSEKRLEPATINNYSAALRFFFAVTLNRRLNYLQIPLMKVPKKLPEILTRDEVAELVSGSANAKHKALFLTAYGSGLRSGELAKLKVSDIDSQAMRVFVRVGKGQKDRYTILSEASLFALRDYWRKYRPKSPEGYIFPGSKNIGYISENAIRKAVKSTVEKTSIRKNITTHTLRHCFATHLLEDGLGLLQIKELLGHSSIESTTIYLHLANTTAGVVSPADKLPEEAADYSI